MLWKKIKKMLLIWYLDRTIFDLEGLVIKRCTDLTFTFLKQENCKVNTIWKLEFVNSISLSYKICFGQKCDYVVFVYLCNIRTLLWNFPLFSGRNLRHKVYKAGHWNHQQTRNMVTPQPAVVLWITYCRVRVQRRYGRLHQGRGEKN